METESTEGRFLTRLRSWDSRVEPWMIVVVVLLVVGGVFLERQSSARERRVTGLLEDGLVYLDLERERFQPFGYIYRDNINSSQCPKYGARLLVRADDTINISFLEPAIARMERDGWLANRWFNPGEAFADAGLVFVSRGDDTLRITIRGRTMSMTAKSGPCDWANTGSPGVGYSRVDVIPPP